MNILIVLLIVICFLGLIACVGYLGACAGAQHWLGLKEWLGIVPYGDQQMTEADSERDKATQDQIAAVMLLHGTGDQMLEALQYCGIRKVITNPVNCATPDKCLFRTDEASASSLVYYPPTLNAKGENVNPDRNTMTTVVQCLVCKKKFTKKETNGEETNYAEIT